MSHQDPMGIILYWMMLMFVLGFLGRFLAQRCHQPGVLGEVLIGVVLGNLGSYLHMPVLMMLREGEHLFSLVTLLWQGTAWSDAVIQSGFLPDQIHFLKSLLLTPSGAIGVHIANTLDVFSKYGLIFLLFMVGLESSVSELRQTGRAACRVAVMGVVGPLMLGFLIMKYLLPEASFQTNLFVGATLTATSVGITAAVLKEMHQMKTREAKTILGAAMIDDVLGLILLALVSSLIVDGTLEPFALLKMLTLTLLFLGLVLWVVPHLMRWSAYILRGFPMSQVKLWIAFVGLMSLSWLATKAHLSSIVGAFAAGLVLNDHDFEGRCVVSGQESPTFHTLMAPFEFLMAPLFFVLMGVQVKLETFWDVHVFQMAFGLMVVAVIGKLLSGLGADQRDDRWFIGIGMLPRGEVGLVFASLGRSLGVISDTLFSAIILMIVMTTLMTPIALKKRFLMRKRSEL